LVLGDGERQFKFSILETWLLADLPNRGFG
jgi:hypothetical protein